METKYLLQIALGSFSILFGTMLVSKFEFSGAATVDAILTFLIGYFLVLMGGILWVGTGVGIIRES